MESHPPFGLNLDQSRLSRPSHDLRPTHMEGEAPPPFNTLLLSSENSRETFPHSTVPSTDQQKTPTMANFVVDPCLHVPSSWELEDPPANPLLHQEVYVSGCYTLHNEDLAIAKLHPAVNKDDFCGRTF